MFCMYVCVYMHVCVHVGGPWLMLGISLHDSPALFIDARSLNQTQSLLAWMWLVSLASLL